MKHIEFVFSALIVLALILLSACAKPPGSPSSASQTPKAAIACQVYDTCTYIQNGLVAAPAYDCTSITYQAAQHPEIPAQYFGASPCLTVKEDFRTVNTPCGPNYAYSCPESVQGPGPLALPALSL